MKGQKKSSRRRSPEEGQEDPGYVQLRELSVEVRPRAASVLSTLMDLGISTEALGQPGDMEQPIQKLFAKELSCSRYFRWAFVDNFVEKILQGLILNKQDVSQEEISFCKSMIRQVPSGRSLLLYHACALRKVYAARGFVLTTEMVLNQAVKISIAFFLSYRLYEGFTADNSDFLGLTTIFEDNSKKGVNSLVNVLAKAPSEQAYLLYLLLTSPAIMGVLKGLWDTRKGQLLTEDDITKLRESVEHHTNKLVKRSYLFRDVLRQLFPMPGLSSVSERVQKAEQQIRWDGRIKGVERDLLFSNIEKLALYGTGMSQINAMQSLAKVVHSFSIKDFKRLQQVGYRQETLLQILRIKVQALHDLRRLANGIGVQPEAQQKFEAALQQSFISRTYATYLLWWLGMGNAKSALFFWPFKFGKLLLEALFLKTIIESILEAIRCPDKKYFNLGSGEYEVRANDLTPECFKEFVRQFRFLSKEESFESFLAQLNNFDFTEVESIDLSRKTLTSNESIKILNILKNKSAPIKVLNLTMNEINDTTGLLFPNRLQSLDLSYNRIGDEGAKGLQLPASLQSLNLKYNGIGAEGAKRLKFLPMLQFLDLYDNNIGAEGAKGLNLPSSLKSLILYGNNISVEGARGLQLPSMLQSLNLRHNNIGAEGVRVLQLPLSLQSLDLSNNNIGAEGTKGLQLPSMLQSLDLSANFIGNKGAKELQLPASLQDLNLNYNQIGTEGAQGLQFPSSLKSLWLNSNSIRDAGAKGLRLPSTLHSLDLSYSQIGDEGAKGLQLPTSLQSLDLGENQIGDEGAKGLKLPSMLTSLSLRENNIGAEGAKGLQFPLSLQFLDISYNYDIDDEAAKGLQLPLSLQSLYLSANRIRAEGAEGLQFPSSLQSLGLSSNNISAEGARGLQLPASLTDLDLSNSNIGDEGAKGLRLPSMLYSLDLSYNQIGEEGAKGLKLPSSLKYLILYSNNIADEGAKGLQLPSMLQSLELKWNNISAEGARGLQLPTSLIDLGLEGNNISNEGVKGLQLPPSLQSLDLSNNKIGDEGVNALSEKIPKTQLTTIILDDNPYDPTAISLDRVVQQQTLLRNCRDKLCHVNTPLWQQDESQTSSATRAQPPLFFSWLKKSFDTLSEYARDCISTKLDILGTRLQKALSQSPSYFPNIHSPVIHDWQPARSESVMLYQYNARGSNTLLLLSGTQAATQPSLRVIAG